jgi:hypothetical protein
MFVSANSATAWPTSPSSSASPSPRRSYKAEVSGSSPLTPTPQDLLETVEFFLRGRTEQELQVPNRRNAHLRTEQLNPEFEGTWRWWEICLTLVGPRPSRRDSGGDLAIASVARSGLGLCTSYGSSGHGECDSRDASNNSLAHSSPGSLEWCGCQSVAADSIPVHDSAQRADPIIKGTACGLDPGEIEAPGVRTASKRSSAQVSLRRV